MGDTEPTPVTVQVQTETRNLRSLPFVVPDEQIKEGLAWDTWLEGIEREFRYNHHTTR